MVLLSYTTYISIDLAHHKIFCAKVGKGGIKGSTTCLISLSLFVLQATSFVLC